MGLRFAYLGSGSRGNGLLVEAGQTRVLVDCGFTVAEAERRLANLGCDPAELNAVLVTHEHGDHIGGVARLARKYDLTVWMTPGTRASGRCKGCASVGVFSAHESFVIADLEIQPFPVPHDAREPAQFVFSDGSRRLGLLTDTGASTPHIEACLSGVDGLLLECNHDAGMLAAGRYSPQLKRRVAGRMGHLSNTQAAGLLTRIDASRLQHLVAAHLSQENNTPERAATALAEALGCSSSWVAIADQDEGLDWRHLS